MNNYPLILKMMEYYAGRPKQIQHFMKVYAYAKLIGEMEHISPEFQRILETAAITHDIGIRASEIKYGNSSGKNQELEGPPEARKMLWELGYDEELIQRVCYLIGHHHTYQKIDGIDYQILVEADFLVNLYENGNDSQAVKTALERIFVTETGKTLCRTMFGIQEPQIDKKGEISYGTRN